MRILMSAYGCSPVLGSEPGVGWRWARELALAGHEVTVVTHPFFRSTIELALAAEAVKGLSFVYVEPRGFGVRRKPGSLNSRFYYVIWQWFAFRAARRLLHHGQKFDVAHHITWGTFRFASFFGHLGLPFVFGPVGGGEMGQQELVSSLPMREQLKELARRAFIKVAKLDPLVWQTLRSADIVFCKSKDTQDCLPFSPRPRGMVVTQPEIGSPPVDPLLLSAPTVGRLKLLYAGRLISWKGCHLAVQALAVLRNRGVDADLTLIGHGNLRAFLVALVTRLRLTEWVTFAGHVPQSQLLEMYRSADVFVFPSLHDSSGNVVLEALSRGLPVVCLDLGGPPQFLEPNCSRVVKTGGAPESMVVERLASALQEIAAMTAPERAAMRQAALNHAAKQTWQARITDAYGVVARHLRLPETV